MENKIDARGKACPIPVIMAKKEADHGASEFSILVDNKTAVENLKRFGKSSGYETAAETIEQDFAVVFTKSGGAGGTVESGGDGNTADGAGESCGDGNTADGAGESCGCQLMDDFKPYAVFVGREGIGEGDPELGASLLRMFFYTLAQESDIPAYILFMNGGVKVPVENDQAVEQLMALEEMGVQLLVCGACLNFFNIADKLQVGTVSNMYDIAGAMRSVDKVITL